LSDVAETRHARSDAHIAYQVIGDGPIDLVLFGTFVSHVELNWEDPSIAQFLHGMASFARVIVFDKRGVACEIVDGARPSRRAIERNEISSRSPSDSRRRSLRAGTRRRVGDPKVTARRGKGDVRSRLRPAHSRCPRRCDRSGCRRAVNRIR
jgi:hypothetical protein